jgi:hypothetical protein
MGYSIKLSDLSNMDESEREAAIAELFRRAQNPTEEEISEWEEQIQNELIYWENAYGISTDEMKHRVNNGLMEADDCIHKWLSFMHQRDRFNNLYPDKKIVTPLQGKFLNNIFQED